MGEDAEQRTCEHRGARALVIGGGVVMLKLLFLMSNYDPTYVYGVRDNIGTLLVTR